MKKLTKLELRSISYSYGDTAVLRDIRLTVEEGQFVSLLGPSGCGKSTLLHIVSGLLPCPGADILVNSQTASIRHFAYMPQDDLLMPWRTVLQNACLYADINGKNSKAALEQARSLLGPFGLEGSGDLFPSQLSGGMRQRAAFLRTFLCEADIFLLDEPFGALDALTRTRMQEWLAEMRLTLQRNRTFLLVTHDIDEAILLSDRILILGGTPAEISAEFDLNEPPEERNRDWLLAQTTLKKEIYDRLA
jgi:ABC-type nitrate/sulfonate/bicarbonate transport system ATPase subunit